MGERNEEASKSGVAPECQEGQGRQQDLHLTKSLDPRKERKKTTKKAKKESKEAAEDEPKRGGKQRFNETLDPSLAHFLKFGFADPPPRCKLKSIKATAMLKRVPR